MQWSCLLAVVLSAVPAAACSHGHTTDLLVSLPFLSVDFRTGYQHRPCPEEVVLASAPTPPPMVFAQPVYAQPVFVQPARPQYVYVAPAPAPNVMARVDPPWVMERPARLGIKYLPGFNSAVVWNEVLAVGKPTFAHSLGLEYRFNHWLTARSDFEMRSTSRSWDALGLKLSLPIPVVSPYVSASLSASEATSAPGRYSLGAVAAAGVDVKLGRHFFIEGEVRYRVAPGDCCREEPQLTALLGAGVAFF